MTNVRVTVLYVDDEPINIMLFETIFGKKYKVLSASSGEVGMQMLEVNSDIKVVVSDMNMPGMSGLEFASKAKEVYAQIHFFILTGYEVNPEITSAIEEGIILKNFRKPFNAKEIEHSISAQLSP